MRSRKKKKTKTNINELDGGSEPEAEEEEEIVQKKPKSKAKAKKTKTEEEELSVIDRLNKLWEERKKTLERTERRSQYCGNGRGRGGRGRGRGGQSNLDSSRYGERFECFNCRRLEYHYASECPEDKYYEPKSTKPKTRGSNNRYNGLRTRINEVEDEDSDSIDYLNF